MPLIGLLLAGGEATRLPNKLLLPVRSPWGPTPMVVAAARYLEARVDKLYVLVEEDSLVPRILHPYIKQFTAITDSFFGVTGALAAASRLGTDNDDFLVCCGDNLYPENEPLPETHGCVVRPVTKEQLDSLDHYDQRWQRRTPNSMPGALALTTPWFLSCVQLRMAGEETNVPNWLNNIKAAPLLVSGQGWADLGTPEAYRAHWRQS